MNAKSPYTLKDNQRFANALLAGLVSDWATKGKAWPDYTLDHPLILGDSEAFAASLIAKAEGRYV